jgi:hypothetical protein
MSERNLCREIVRSANAPGARDALRSDGEKSSTRWKFISAGESRSNLRDSTASALAEEARSGCTA